MHGAMAPALEASLPGESRRLEIEAGNAVGRIRELL